VVARRTQSTRWVPAPRPAALPCGISSDCGTSRSEIGKPADFDFFVDNNSSVAPPLPPQIPGRSRLAVTLPNTKAKFGGFTLSHVRAVQEETWGSTFNAAADVIATPSVPVAQAVLSKLKPPQLEEMQRYTNELRRLGADNAAYTSSTASRACGPAESW
jgi:hypothetical protein